MPTYSYACTQCDNRFDIVQSFTDDSLTECPECSGRLRKLFNSVGIVFKGSGFYRTDSRAGGSTVSSESKSESSESKSDSKSSDVKTGDSKSGNSETSKSESSSKSATAMAS